MHRVRRQEARQRYYRPAKIRLAAGARACDCRVVDMSDSGVRLNVEGLDVPDEFVLLISNNRKVQEKAYKAVWRFGNESGAKFVSGARQPSIAKRVLLKRDASELGSYARQGARSRRVGRTALKATAPPAGCV